MLDSMHSRYPSQALRRGASQRTIGGRGYNVRGRRVSLGLTGGGILNWPGFRLPSTFERRAREALAHMLYGIGEGRQLP